MNVARVSILHVSVTRFSVVHVSVARGSVVHTMYIKLYSYFNKIQF